MGLRATTSWGNQPENAAGRLMMGKTVVSLDDGKPKKTGKTVRLPETLWGEVDECLEFETELRRVANLNGNFSLNDLLQQFAKWAVDQYWKENGPRPKDMKDRDAINRALESRLKSARGEGGKAK